MKFIKLTSKNGTTLRVNFDVVECYFKETDEDFTRIYSVASETSEFNMDSHYEVNESPEEIDEMVGSVWYVH